MSSDDHVNGNNSFDTKAVEEFFDVVDESDVVIDRLPRSVVHQRRLLHRAIHVFLFRSDGQLLIHLRSPAKEEFPGVWTSSASGHVASGETYDATAPRELHEELGIVTDLVRLRKFAACPETSQEFTVLYEAVSDSEVSADPEEISGTQWLSIEHIADWLNHSPSEFSPAFILLFRWFLEHRCSDGSFPTSATPA